MILIPLDETKKMPLSKKFYLSVSRSKTQNGDQNRLYPFPTLQTATFLNTYVCFVMFGSFVCCNTLAYFFLIEALVELRKMLLRKKVYDHLIF